MEKITLKLLEFYALDAELNGTINTQTGAKITNGLLQEKLPLVTKYWLTDLGKKVAAEKAAIEELKNELIRKFGKADDKGNISIPMLIDEESEDAEGNKTSKKAINPDYQSFEKEFNELLQTEKEVEYKGFKLSEFEKVETSENYEVFFGLVSVEETAG